MKKIIILFLAVLFSTNYFSQTYYKMLDKDTTTWQHFNCYIPVRLADNAANYFPLDRPLVALDSITINANLYKKIYYLSSYGLNYAGKTLVGYIREDTVAKRVFYRETMGSTDYLLYDFSLTIGDSTLLTFINGNSNNGYYRLDSIKIKNERCGARRHFYMRKHINNTNPNQNYIDWVESIGATLHSLYLYASPAGGICQFVWYNSSTCKHYWPVGLACKHNNLKKQYQSCTFAIASMISCINKYDSCNYFNICSGLKDNDYNKSVSVHPNPTNNNCIVTLDADVTELSSGYISDITGKKIMIVGQKNSFINDTQFEINTKNLKDGIYFLILNSSTYIYKKQLIISH